MFGSSSGIGFFSCPSCSSLTSENRRDSYLLLRVLHIILVILSAEFYGVLEYVWLDGMPEHNCRLVGNLPRSSVQLDTNMLTGLLYTCVHLPLHNYGCTHQEKLTSSSPFFSTSEAGTAVLGDSQYTPTIGKKNLSSFYPSHLLVLSTLSGVPVEED